MFLFGLGSTGPKSCVRGPFMARTPVKSLYLENPWECKVKIGLKIRGNIMFISVLRETFYEFLVGFELFPKNWFMHYLQLVFLGKCCSQPSLSYLLPFLYSEKSHSGIICHHIDFHSYFMYFLTRNTSYF